MGKARARRSVARSNLRTPSGQRDVNQLTLDSYLVSTNQTHSQQGQGVLGTLCTTMMHVWMSGKINQILCIAMRSPDASNGSDSQGSIQIAVEARNSNGELVLGVNTVANEKVQQAQEIIAKAINNSIPEQKKAIEEAIQVLYPYPPREGQRDALHQLIYLRKSLILIAKTSFGKSMILQAVSCLLCKSISLVILPLDRIGVEQAEYISRIGGKPCFLNSDSISDEFLKDVAKGNYTHILMSPELAVGERLRRTLLTPTFKKHLSLVVVDEVHLVSLDIARLIFTFWFCLSRRIC